MPFPPQTPEIADLAGLWRRTLYVDPEGRRDTASAVWWLQAGPLCGDVRAPRPGAPAETAFAGRLERAGDVFGWRFEQSFGYPPDAPPDEGRLRWEGDVLREDGVHLAYLEHWRREAGDVIRAGRFAGGTLIEIGDVGFCARDGRFLLAEQGASGWRVRLAANLAVAPGDAVAWPVVSGETIRFPDSPLGPSGALSFDPAPA
jgi:hypothetical protein